MEGDLRPPPYSYMAGLPLPEKWKKLKRIITRLYLNEKRNAPEVQQILRDQYGFDAGIHQLKYQIKQWKLNKKNIPTSKKKDMIEAYEARRSKGKATTFQYKGVVVDNNKLARLARSEISKSLGGLKKKTARNPNKTTDPLTIAIAPRIFFRWNMPYGALKSSHTGPINHVSPMIVAPTPAGYSDVSVKTPAAQDALSPPAESPSGLSRALKSKTRLERAYMFVEGNQDELLKTLDKSEQIVACTWLYHFWLFAFKTARHWGRGHRNWTNSLLDLDVHMEQLSISAATTPAAQRASPEADRHHVSPSQWLTDGVTPSILCNWGVHILGMDYEHADVDSDDSDWEDCPESWRRESFLDKLREGLKSNVFSNLDSDDLPIALPRLLQNSTRSRDQLLEDGLAFSIMGRNVHLMFSVARKVKRRAISLEGLYPFHLATSYLSGSYPCCNVFCGLLYLPQTFPIREMYVNDRGHTVLDNLMMAIVKSHSNCLPGDVDERMKRQKRFAGEEVDICGRWDADSDELRALLARRIPRIPMDWKHKFCHTSAQVICHCISLMFGAPWSPNIDHASGLFKETCQHCGRELVLLPLHSLVMVAFQLAQRGCEEEDLFGIIACLLCLLSKGANPLLASNLSAAVLFGTAQDWSCSHEMLTPLGLADRIPYEHFANWSPALHTGWRLLCHVLRMSQTAMAYQRNDSNLNFGSLNLVADTENINMIEIDAVGRSGSVSGVLSTNWAVGQHRSTHAGTAEDPMELDQDDETNGRSVDDHYLPHHECSETNYFKHSPDLGDLWAAAQAELLTYRRLRDGDSWVSPKFAMHEIVESLESGGGVRRVLHHLELLRSYCGCGTFLSARDKDCACVDEVCEQYYSNLEEWERTTYLYRPEKWRCEQELDEELESDYSDDDDDDDNDDDEEDFPEDEDD